MSFLILVKLNAKAAKGNRKGREEMIIISIGKLLTNGQCRC